MSVTFSWNINSTDVSKVSIYMYRCLISLKSIILMVFQLFCFNVLCFITLQVDVYLVGIKKSQCNTNVNILASFHILNIFAGPDKVFSNVEVTIRILRSFQSG